MNHSFRSEIILSVNRALLGEVFPALVGVCCSIEGEGGFDLTFFVDAEPTALVEEDISCIETDVIADFSDSVEVSHRIEVSTKPGLPTSSSFWIFLRRYDRSPSDAVTKSDG